LNGSLKGTDRQDPDPLKELREIS